MITDQVGIRLSTASRHAAFAGKRRTVLRESDRNARLAAECEHVPTDELLRRGGEAAVRHARFAMESTRFYRQFYTDAGLTSADLRDPEVFSSLPIVEKHHVREHFAEFRTPEALPANVSQSSTGGSTGEPLRILRDTRVSAQPLEWRLFDWWGVHPSDNVAIVFRHIKTGRQERVHAAKWWPSRRIQLDAYQISEDKVREFAHRWSRVRPALLTGYAGGVLELARTLRRLGLEVQSPLAVATTASPLTTENRREVESILGAPVYDHYRSSEIPWMGGECREQSGHHIFVGDRVLELVDEDHRVVPDGQYGQVVATDLTNRVFPLIRYRLGDRSRALPGLCACGVTLPRIDRVAGRQTDGIRLPDGTWVAGVGLYQIFNEAAYAVRQFQFDQAADYSLVVRCIRGDDPEADHTVATVVEHLRMKLQHAVSVRWEWVDTIPHEGGKIRYIRSVVA